MRAYGFTLVSGALVLLYYFGFFSAGIVVVPVWHLFTSGNRRIACSRGTSRRSCALVIW